MEMLWFLLNCEDQSASTHCVNSITKFWIAVLNGLGGCSYLLCNFSEAYRGFFCFVEVGSPSYYSVPELLQKACKDDEDAQTT